MFFINYAATKVVQLISYLGLSEEAEIAAFKWIEDHQIIVTILLVLLIVRFAIAILSGIASVILESMRLILIGGVCWLVYQHVISKGDLSLNSPASSASLHTTKANDNLNVEQKSNKTVQIDPLYAHITTLQQALSITRQNDTTRFNSCFRELLEDEEEDEAETADLACIDKRMHKMQCELAYMDVHDVKLSPTMKQFYIKRQRDIEQFMIKKDRYVDHKKRRNIQHRFATVCREHFFFFDRFYQHLAKIFHSSKAGPSHGETTRSNKYSKTKSQKSTAVPITNRADHHSSGRINKYKQARSEKLERETSFEYHTDEPDVEDEEIHDEPTDRNKQIVVSEAAANFINANGYQLGILRTLWNKLPNMGNSDSKS